MGEGETYMLQRDQEESNRLNEQSRFLRALFNNFLVHPSIPRTNLHAIADVGTGTGVWMTEVQQELDESTTTLGGQTVQFVGFDVSDDQFPRQKRHGQEFLVHDAAQPFPARFHDGFDLVHVRFLSYGIKAHQLENFVDSVLQILRPGGYLQWQEIDGIDMWTIPETFTSQQMISWLVSERIARGLTPAITAPLIKILQSRSTPTRPGTINPMCWTNDLLRIYNVETLSTYQHPSPKVNSFKNQWTTTVLMQLFQSGAARRSALAKEPRTSPIEIERLEREITEINEFIQTVKSREDAGISDFEVSVTRIVARKAMLVSAEDLWMSTWHGTAAK